MTESATVRTPMASVSRLETASGRKFPRLCRPTGQDAVTISTCAAPSLAVVIVAIAGVAGALAFGALANEREFDRLIAEGDSAVAAERPFQAIEAYSGAIARKPDSMLAHFKRGAVYQSQNELEAALRDFRSAADIDPSSLRALEVARRRQRGARPQRARRRALRGVHRPRRSQRPRPLQARPGALSRRTAEGRRCRSCSRRWRSIPRWAKRITCSASCSAISINWPPRASRSRKRRAARRPARRRRAKRWRTCICTKAITARAINQLEALAALEPTRPDRVVAVGLAQARAGREDAAVITLGRAVERFPDAPQVYAALGHVWLTEAQRRGDRVALNKAVEALAAGGEPFGCDERHVRGAGPRVAAGRRSTGRRARVAPGGGASCRCRRTPICSWRTSPRATDASRMRAMRC